MPPTGKLSDDEIQRLIAWVKMGAPDPRKEVAAVAPQPAGIDFEKARAFWAFRKIQQVSVPAVRQTAWVRSPIDNFVLAQLERNGLRPAPPADKHAWLRRITFDLIGLPPTPREIEDYLSDTSATGSAAGRGPTPGFSALWRTLGPPLAGLGAFRGNQRTRVRQ